MLFRISRQLFYLASENRLCLSRYRCSVNSQLPTGIQLNYAVTEGSITKNDEQKTRKFGNRPRLPLRKGSNVTESLLVETFDVFKQLQLKGVDLSHLSEYDNVTIELSQMDFNSEILPKMEYLEELGLSQKDFVKHIKHHIKFLKHDLNESIKTTEFFKYKGFTESDIQGIFRRVESFPVVNKGAVKKNFEFLKRTCGGLSDQEIKWAFINAPKALLSNLDKIKMRITFLQVVLGFTDSEMKKLIISDGRLLKSNQSVILRNYKYMHREMKIPRYLMAEYGACLYKNVDFLRIRHTYLVKLRKNNYKPEDVGYVSLEQILSLTDQEFCDIVTNTTLGDYQEHLASLIHLPIANVKNV